MPRTLAPYLMIAPAVALTLWVIAYPLVDISIMATHAVTRFAQIRQYVGIDNLVEVANDPIFQGSLWRTVLWTVVVVTATTIIAFPLSLILSDDFAGRTLARIIIMLPWATSVAMTAIVWRWALNGQFGMVNAMLFRLGLLHQPVEWLATASRSLPLAMGIGVVVSLPFTVTILLGGIASLPGEIYEAAKLDGASPFAAVRHLTLPLMMPFINMSIVLNTIYTFNSFAIIWVLTQGEPANTTDIAVTYLYKLAFRYGKLADASVISLLMLAALLVFTAVYMSLVRRWRSA
jgi:multiple sugar transport system permease protein